MCCFDSNTVSLELNILFVYHYLIGLCSSLLNYELYGWCGQQENLVLGPRASTWLLLWSRCWVFLFFFFFKLSKSLVIIQTLMMVLTFLLSWEIVYYASVKGGTSKNFINSYTQLCLTGVYNFFRPKYLNKFGSVKLKFNLLEEDTARRYNKNHSRR